MSALNTAKIIRRVRHRLEVSQEGLSRLLNATKGAIQHWERGRNNPDLARLLALRQLCPPGAERKELEALIRQVQAEVAPLPSGGPSLPKGDAGGKGVPLPPLRPNENLVLLRRENARFRRQVDKLQATIERKNEKLRILEDLATELQREVAQLRAGGVAKTSGPPNASSTAP
ncbi:MAG: helix-turn-helix domain-containing protein [Acidobacteriia bacterium]|nr:helix-turn-helix domain-containing protein [Terriglobia bacterium]